MEYYIANAITRQVIDGPFVGGFDETSGSYITARQQADARFIDICHHGIRLPDGDSDRQTRPIVIIGRALTPNEHGNQFVDRRAVSD